MCPQSERDELTEDGEGSIRSSEEGPGDSVFTAPAESEGSGPEEKSPGQQVRLCWHGALGGQMGRGCHFFLSLIHRWVRAW